MKDFTVGGKPRHKRVFSEVLDIPFYNGFNKGYLFLAADRDERIEKDFNQTNKKGTIHFELPLQWDAAMKYAREFFGLENKSETEELISTLENPNNLRNEKITIAKILLDALTQDIADLKKDVEQKKAIVDGVPNPSAALINDLNKSEGILKEAERKVVGLLEKIRVEQEKFPTDNSTKYKCSNHNVHSAGCCAGLLGVAMKMKELDEEIQTDMEDEYVLKQFIKTFKIK